MVDEPNPSPQDLRDGPTHIEPPQVPPESLISKRDAARLIRAVMRPDLLDPSDPLLQIQPEDHAIAVHGVTLADVKRGILRIDGDGWIRIDPNDPSTLPKLGQSVALVNVDRWENCGGDMRRNVHACGYLDNAGCVHPYWSIRSDRPQEISAYTHWFPLPEAPGLRDEE